MVPSSVSSAWQDLPENKKVAISRACAKQFPSIFSRWVDAAGLKKFRHESLVNRKGGAAPRLDAALFKAENGQMAMDLLVAYFTEMAPTINSQYLELLQQAAQEDAATKLAIYAQLADSHRASAFIQLYLATALWVEEFDESELATVNRRAAELAAAGGE